VTIHQGKRVDLASRLRERQVARSCVDELPVAVSISTVVEPDGLLLAPTRNPHDAAAWPDDGATFVDRWWGPRGLLDASSRRSRDGADAATTTRRRRTGLIQDAKLAILDHRVPIGLSQEPLFQQQLDGGRVGSGELTLE
jgi:hypothetical protein